jgi:hypothetical protein
MVTKYQVGENVFVNTQNYEFKGEILGVIAPNEDPRFNDTYKLVFGMNEAKHSKGTDFERYIVKAIIAKKDKYFMINEYNIFGRVKKK